MITQNIQGLISASQQNQATKVPKPISGASIGGIPAAAPGSNMPQRNYIPELDAAVSEIKKLQQGFLRIIEMKDMLTVSQKIT